LKVGCRVQKLIYSPRGTSGLFWRLKHLHDGFNSLHTETTLRVTNVQWILVSPELGPEVALGSEVEGRGKAIVRLFESDDLKPADVIYTVKLIRGTGPESRASNANFTHFLDDMRKGVLDRSERSAREFQCPLDLEPV